MDGQLLEINIPETVRLNRGLLFCWRNSNPNDIEVLYIIQPWAGSPLDHVLNCQIPNPPVAQAIMNQFYDTYVGQYPEGVVIRLILDLPNNLTYAHPYDTEGVWTVTNLGGPNPFFRVWGHFRMTLMHIDRPQGGPFSAAMAISNMIHPRPPLVGVDPENMHPYIDLPFIQQLQLEPYIVGLDKFVDFNEADRPPTDRRGILWVREDNEELLYIMTEGIQATHNPLIFQASLAPINAWNIDDQVVGDHVFAALSPMINNNIQALFIYDLGLHNGQVRVMTFLAALRASLDWHDRYILTYETSYYRFLVPQEVPRMPHGSYLITQWTDEVNNQFRCQMRILTHPPNFAQHVREKMPISALHGIFRGVRSPPINLSVNMTRYCLSLWGAAFVLSWDEQDQQWMLFSVYGSVWRSEPNLQAITFLADVTRMVPLVPFEPPLAINLNKIQTK